MRKLQRYGSVAVMLLASTLALAEGDASKGKRAYIKCVGCHQVGPNAQSIVGPELNNIVGRKAASISGFAYSPAMKKLGDEGFVWSEEELDRLIANPKAMLPDSPMQLFAGIPDAQVRADIIAYLKVGPAQ